MDAMARSRSICVSDRLIHGSKSDACLFVFVCLFVGLFICLFLECIFPRKWCFSHALHGRAPVIPTKPHKRSCY